LAETRQFLRIGLVNAGTNLVDYLLPSNTSYVIEKREHLEINDAPGALIAAWQATPTGRAPAYSVDANLDPLSRHAWQRAVFIQVGRQTLGLIADELQLLSNEDVRVEPFMPPGPAPTPAGHLFGGAWVRAGHAPVLVFEPGALADYLMRLEAAA
jgi:hypothetical protein